MSRRGRRHFVTLILLALFVCAVLLLLQRDWELQAQKKQLKESLATTLQTEIDDDYVRELPEVDFDFWFRFAEPNNLQLNHSCARYPNPRNLQFHNEVWQTFINRNVTFRLYAAYLDKRAAVYWSPGIVRILATANQMGYRFPPTHCQLWYEGHRQPIVVLISEYLNIWPIHWGNFPRLSYPHLMSCPLPESLNLPPHLRGVTPRTLSLTSRYCDNASNSLKINHGVRQSANSSSSSQLSFGVCLKAFDFPDEDISQRLIEWFELQRLLGASRIYAHMYAVTPSVQRVLDYYQDIGVLDLRPLTLANGVSLKEKNHQEYFTKNPMVKRLNELIPYNDCFYRNMHRHDYLVNVDIDEVIMPCAELRSWHQIVVEHEKAAASDCSNETSSMCLIHSYFTTGPQLLSDPEELHFLQRTWRSPSFSKQSISTKCFHNARYSATLHNHITVWRLPGSCPRQHVNPELAYLQHYREPSLYNKSEELIEDRTVWKFAKELREEVKLVWAELKQQSEDAEYDSSDEQEEEPAEKSESFVD